MIKTTQQLNRTKKKIEELTNTMETIQNSSEFHEEVKPAYINNYKALISELESEINEYESLTRGELEIPEGINILDFPKYITKIRIAKGLSQKELADTVGLKKQAINRYEEHDYQTASLAKIKEILEALNYDIETNLVEASESIKLMDCDKEAQSILNDFESLICELNDTSQNYEIESILVALDLFGRRTQVIMLVSSLENSVQQFINTFKTNAGEIFKKHQLTKVSCTFGIHPIENAENIETEKQNVINMLKYNRHSTIREIAC